MRKADIANLLPEVFQRAAQDGTALNSLLEVMATLSEPVEECLDTFPSVLSAKDAPEAFVPMLARFVDLDRILRPAGRLEDFPTGSEQLRLLIKAAPFLARTRGTAVGLTRFLETATGATGFTISENPDDDTGAARQFHIRVTAPGSTLPYKKMLEHIILCEKPAYVTHELVFDGLVAPITPKPVSKPKKKLRASRSRKKI